MIMDVVLYQIKILLLLFYYIYWGWDQGIGNGECPCSHGVCHCGPVEWDMPRVEPVIRLSLQV